MLAFEFVENQLVTPAVKICPGTTESWPLRRFSTNSYGAGAGVAWRVLKEPVEISKAQIDSFRKLYKMNARPVQPLNGRKVQESS